MNSAPEAYREIDAAELRHGLRTPLNHIIGYAEMLREDAVQRESHQVQTELEQLLGTAQHICDLLHHDPAFSQPAITNKDLAPLRSRMCDPVGRLQSAASKLSKLEIFDARADLERIEKAVNELVEFAQYGRRAEGVSMQIQHNVQTSAATPGQGHLLVVDDDEANRDILRRHLERQGYHVEEAANGLEAIARLHQQPFDAVLLDLVMPEVGGLTVLTSIKQDAALHAIPVLVISASDELAAVAQSIESGAEDYLVKPFDPILLRARLTAALDRKRFRDQERSKSEKLEQVTRALQRSNEDLQRFAYAASHDLQAPLRTITSYLQLLTRRLGGRLQQDEQELIGFAIDGAKRMTTLVQDLLSYSQASMQEQSMEPVDCNALLTQLLSDLKVAVDESGARIGWDYLPVIQAERSGLRRLFQNLVGNAIKYRAARPLEVHISAYAQEESWTFCVRDNGVGIPDQYTKRVFEIFQRLHGGDVPGNGIGLAICQRIVERLGGKIWVESEVNVGSRFYFSIPINPISGLADTKTTK